jgi:DNA relaxase NicK
MPSGSRGETVLHAGVDYLTCTGLTKKSSMKLATRAHSLMLKEQRRGNTVSKWGMAGFNGMQVGQIQTGEKNDEVLVRLSGELAASEWRYFVEHCDNVSRIDLQTTVHSDEPTRVRMQRHIGQARRFKRKHPQSGEVTIYDRVVKPKTIYFNERISDRYLRCYDKEFESKLDHFKGCLRYEGEFKHRLGMRIATALLGQECEAAWITAEVCSNFRARGLCCRYHLDDSRPIGLPRSRSDHEKTLDWLHTSVRPSVQRLLDHGLHQEIIEALQLREFMADRFNSFGQSQAKDRKRG